MAPAGIIILIRNINTTKGQATFNTVLTTGKIFPYSFSMAKEKPVGFLLFVRDMYAPQHTGLQAQTDIECVVAKDGSVGFDHSGKYDKVIKNELIKYTVSDGRKSIIRFVPNGDCTNVIETFDPEKETPIEEQRKFTQAVLDNFKKYAEGLT